MKYLYFDFHYGRGDSFYIESTAVLPAYQGKGIGTMMKKSLIEEVKEEGYKRITCHATNETIRDINEKLGFRVIEIFKKWVGDRDGWYMELKLGD